MKTIKVFIASSEELRLERLEFTDMIQQLNDSLEKRDIQIKPVKWEYLDASMGAMHKQQEYNEKLKECELCLVLYWRKFGDYTKTELDTAYEELKAGRNPRKLYVYFKNADDITSELHAFRDSFATQYGHFYCKFENVDTMKLNFLLQFEAYQNTVHSEPIVRVVDSKVEVAGVPFANLSNIPFAANNADYLELQKHIEKQQRRVLKDPEDIDERQELHDLLEKREKMEQNLLDTAKFITQLSSKTSSARLAEAMRLFEAGDNRGANAVLNLKEIEADAESNIRRCNESKAIYEESKKALYTNLDELKLKAKTIQSEMAESWVQRAINVYEQAISIARKGDGIIEKQDLAELLFETATFKLTNKQYHLIGTQYEEAVVIFHSLVEKNPDAFLPYVAKNLGNLAVLHSDLHNYDLAEEKYNEALVIYRKLAEQNPDAFLHDVARNLGNLAQLYNDLHMFDLAEQEYNESIKIYRELVKDNTDAFLSDLASNLVNLANLHMDLYKYDLVEKDYSEALSIFRKLAEQNPDAFMPNVANILGNIANLHADLRKNDSAEELYNEALEIYRKLAEQNPDAFLSDVARNLGNLAVLHAFLNKYDLAEKEQNEAFDIYRKLAEQNPDAFLPDMARNLCSLAGMHNDLHKYNSAEKGLVETLKIYRKLAKNNADAFLPNVALTLKCIAIVHENLHKYNLAENENDEALVIYRNLAAQNPDAFLPYVARNLGDLANLHYKLFKYDLVEEEYNESLEIFRTLSERNPAAFLPDEARILCYIAIIHYDLHKYELAEEEFNEAMSIYGNLAEGSTNIYNSEIASALNSLAYCQYELGKYDLVISTIEEAIRLYPITEYYDSKGEFLMRLGKKDEAKAVYSQIMEMEPTYFDDNHTDFYKLLFGEE